MSIDKFMSMIYEESLYFPNVTLFEDRDEGRLSHKTLFEEVCKTNSLMSRVSAFDEFCYKINTDNF